MLDGILVATQVEDFTDYEFATESEVFFSNATVKVKFLRIGTTKRRIVFYEQV